MVNQLCFQRFKEAFGYCVIPADPKSGLGLRSIAFSAHALQYRQSFQLLSEIVTGILHPSVRME